MAFFFACRRNKIIRLLDVHGKAVDDEINVDICYVDFSNSFNSFRINR